MKWKSDCDSRVSVDFTDRLYVLTIMQMPSWPNSCKQGMVATAYMGEVLS